MVLPRRTFLLALALLAASTSALHAQPAADPTGHWRGTIKAPEMEVNIELDLVKKPNGQLSGTYTNETRGIKQLPLATIAVQGKSITFSPSPRADIMFKGTLSADGKSMAGDFTGTDATGADFALPFTMTRTGAATIAAATKIGPINKTLEGTWHGILDVEGEKMTLVITMANGADGATGTIMNVDRGGLKAPITGIAQKASEVRLEIKAVEATYSGAINAQGTEMAGTFKQGELSVPLTFKRGAPPAKNE